MPNRRVTHVIWLKRGRAWTQFRDGLHRRDREPGHALGDMQYRNRLFQFLKETIDGSSERDRRQREIRRFA